MAELSDLELLDALGVEAKQEKQAARTDSNPLPVVFRLFSANLPHPYIPNRARLGRYMATDDEV